MILPSETKGSSKIHFINSVAWIDAIMPQTEGITPTLLQSIIGFFRSDSIENSQHQRQQ